MRNDTPLVTVRAVSHIGLTVRDLDRSVAFYSDVLGFRVVSGSDWNGWTRVSLHLDELVLELFSALPDGPRDPDDEMMYPMAFGRPKLALTVADVDAAYEALTAAGIPTIGPVRRTPVSKLIFVLDPDGTPVQLHEFLDGHARVIDFFTARDST